MSSACPDELIGHPGPNAVTIGDRAIVAILGSVALARMASAQTVDFGFDGNFTITSGITPPGGVTTPVTLSGTTTADDLADGSFTIADFQLTSGLSNYSLGTGTGVVSGSTLSLFEDASTFLASFALTNGAISGNTVSATGTLTSGNQDFVLPDGNLIGIQAATGTFSVTLEPPAAVPELASWAMMIAGVGMAGVALRRRPVSVSFA